MKIFIDFDDVLFCTKDFKKDLKDVFKSVGISDEQFDETYNFVRERSEGVIGYNYDEHVEVLSKKGIVKKEILVRAVNDFLVKTEKYVFDDVVDFLEDRIKMGDELFVISFGSNYFQKVKIEKSGLGKYFLDVKVGDINKATEIKKIIGENVSDEMWFVDDRVEQIEVIKKVFPMIKTVLLQRKDGRYFDKKNEFCDFEVGDLGSIEKLMMSK